MRPSSGSLITPLEDFRTQTTLTVLYLTTEEKERIRSYCPNSFTEKDSDVYMLMCAYCTAVWWDFSRLASVGGTGQTVVKLANEPCAECQEVRRCHPVLFAWIERLLVAQKKLDEIRARTSIADGLVSNFGPTP